VNYARSKALAYTDGDSTTGNNGTNLLPRYVDKRVWNYGTPSYDRPNVMRIHFLWDVPRLSKADLEQVRRGGVRRLADFEFHQLHQRAAVGRQHGNFPFD
jgi:hypothetical protein